MSDFLPISSSGPEITTRIDAVRAASNGAARPESHTPPRAVDIDSVELSDRARLLSRLKELPDVRADLIEKARADIASGVYDDPKVFDAALEAMISDIDLIA